jgi:hypothetical protein
MVIFQTPEGNPGYNQFESVEDAVRFIEQLRNDRDVNSARMFRLEEIKFEFKPYFRVELDPPALENPVGRSTAPRAASPAAATPVAGTARPAPQPAPRPAPQAAPQPSHRPAPQSPIQMATPATAQRVETAPPPGPWADPEPTNGDGTHGDRTDGGVRIERVPGTAPSATTLFGRNGSTSVVTEAETVAADLRTTTVEDPDRVVVAPRVGDAPTGRRGLFGR